jgi:hypothetical protein
VHLPHLIGAERHGWEGAAPSSAGTVLWVIRVAVQLHDRTSWTDQIFESPHRQGSLYRYGELNRCLVFHATELVRAHRQTVQVALIRSRRQC